MDPRIRRAGPADAAAVRDIYAPFVSDSSVSFEVEPPDAAEMARRIREIGGRYPWLVLEEGSGILGYAYASPHRARPAYRWCAEVSVYVRADARGRGVGRALYGALLGLLRRQGFVNAYAAVTLPNPASVALHEAVGFARVGVFPRIGFKRGTWHDLLWLHLRLQDPASPAEPLAPEAVFGRAE